MSIEPNGMISVPLRSGKRMKKRKELDALVANDKVRKKVSSSADLLRDSDSTDLEDYSVLRPSVLGRGRLCATCVPVCTALLLACCLVACGTLVWMQMGMRQELDNMRKRIGQVELSSKKTPEAMHDYHHQLSTLKNNQTKIFSDIVNMKTGVDTMAKEIVALKDGLKSVEQSLKDTPELVNLPKNLQALQTSVATFGSQIKDLDSTVADLHKKQSTLESQLRETGTELGTIKAQFSQLTNQSASSSSSNDQKKLQQLTSQLTRLTADLKLVNTTLSSRAQWANDDIHTAQTTLAGLQDTTQNVSTRLTGLEATRSRLVDQVSRLNASHSNLTTTVGANARVLSDVVQRTRTTAAALENLEKKVTGLGRHENNTTTLRKILKSPDLQKELSSTHTNEDEIRQLPRSRG